jgi:hypothetical protein
MNDFDDDDDDPDFNSVTEIEVGVEFEGLHMISLHATVSVDLEDPMAATKRLQNVISILKKSIPASEYTEGELALGKDGTIEPFDEEAAEMDETVRDLQKKLGKKEDKKDDSKR